MPLLRKTAATLRVIGADLVPEEISERLACAPTKSRPGMWHLESTPREPGNLDVQIMEILSKVTNDLDVWQDLARAYDVNLFCGLFMDGGNEGLHVSPHSLAALGQRGIELQLDIYGLA